jgi:hypothetical protein
MNVTSDEFYYDGNGNRLSKEDFEIRINNSLKYLIAEGMVIEKNNTYRLKTKAEINKELDDIKGS